MRRAVTLSTALLTALFAAGCGSSSGTTIRADSTLPAALAPSSAGTSSATPSGPPSAAADAVGAWYAGGAKKFTATLTSDITSISTDSQAHDRDSLNTDCLQLTADVNRAQQYSPAPDPTMQQLWSTALSQLHQGFWDCNGGFSDNDSAEVSKGVSEIQAAAAALTEVGRRAGGS